MKNKQLQLAIISSLIHESVLLDEQRKKVLLKKIPGMTDGQLEELQLLVSGEERIVIHPRELGVEEILESADEQTVQNLNVLLDSSMEELKEMQKQISEEVDDANANAILADLA